MKENKTLSSKIKELDQNIYWFYSDDFNLDEVEWKYKESITLAKELQADLNELKNRIEILTEDFTK